MEDIFRGKNAKRQLQHPDEGENNWPKRSKFIEGRLEQMSINVLLKNQRAKGAIIGKQGNSIRKIRKECDVTFSISKIIGSEEQTALVKGEWSGVAQALIRAAACLQEAFEEEVKSITLLVENRNMGALLGVRGERVKEIRNRTKCKVYTSPSPIGTSSQNIIEISGREFDEAVTSVIRALSAKVLPTRIPYVPGETDGNRMELEGPWNKRPMDGRFGGMAAAWSGKRSLPPPPVWARGERSYDGPNGGHLDGEYRPHQARFGKTQLPWEPERRRSQRGGDLPFRSQFIKPRQSSRDLPEHDDINNMTMIPLNEQLREGWKGRQSLDTMSNRPLRTDGHIQNQEFLRPNSQMEPDGVKKPPQRRGSGFREERTIFIPIDKISQVIGKGSQSIKRIREHSGAKIALEKERGEDFGDLQLIISGERDSIEQAASMIHKFGNGEMN